MQKTVKWTQNGVKNELKLDNNIGWMIAYREQFGRDIVPALIPVLNAGIDVMFGIVQALKPGEKAGVETLKSIDPDALHDAILQASAIEAVDLINITWALAKNADEEIPEPREWVRQFEGFPMDLIGGAVFDLVFKAMISTKNLNRLRKSVEDLKPTKSTSTN